MGTLFLFATVQVSGWVESGTPAELASVETRTVERGYDGTMWFGVQGHGVARVRGDRLDLFGIEHGLHSTGIADLSLAPDGTVRAAGLGGVSTFVGGEWQTLLNHEGIDPRVVFSVYHSAAGGEWLATNLGAVAVGPDGWRLLTTDDGLPHSVVHGVASSDEGSVWFACRTGLARLTSDGRLEVVDVGTNYRTALSGSAGGVWFGTSDGVRHWDGANWRSWLEGGTIYPRAISSDGSVWAGSASSGLYRFRDDEWRPVVVPARIRGAEIFDVAESEDGAIWLATSVGTIRLLKQ